MEKFRIEKCAQPFDIEPKNFELFKVEGHPPTIADASQQLVTSRSILIPAVAEYFCRMLARSLDEVSSPSIEVWAMTENIYFDSLYGGRVSALVATGSGVSVPRFWVNGPWYKNYRFIVPKEHFREPGI